MRFEIKPGVGLDDLKFGATRDEVESLLGPPDEIDEDLDSDEPSVAYFYWTFDLSLHFDAEDDFLLGTMELGSEQATVEGVPVIGLLKDELVAALATHNLVDPVEQAAEDSDLGERAISYLPVALSFWLEDDHVDTVQWSVVLDENDEPAWPEASD